MPQLIASSQGRSVKLVNGNHVRCSLLDSNEHKTLSTMQTRQVMTGLGMVAEGGHAFGETGRAGVRGGFEVNHSGARIPVRAAFAPQAGSCIIPPERLLSLAMGKQCRCCRVTADAIGHAVGSKHVARRDSFNAACSHVGSLLFASFGIAWTANAKALACLIRL